MTASTAAPAETLDVPTFEIGDRISDAYYGAMGDAFARKVRQRVHWIAEQVQGHAVLDIGCSQGIGCILLGREGHAVEGVDIDAGAIARADEYLSQEPESVRGNVTFRNADFMGADFDGRQFSTIVMGEVLEHLVRPQAFISRAHDLLELQGRIIVTVPFGINDFPDHKRTFYLAEMTRLLHPAFELSAPHYFGRWIGFVGTRRDTPVTDAPGDLGIDAVTALESAFFGLERELVDRVVKLKDALGASQTQRNEALIRAKDATAEHARLLAAMTRAQDELAKAKAEAAAQAARIATLTKANAARISDIAVLGLRLEATAGEVRALYDSTSWKITRPLRAVVRVLRPGR
ncbi:MAG: class I SAM-dependent methyltransferase [Alphaproteobacteria bacterium]|nr:class I SAM-dependent methyltransferase [Alphaproteobacteria bacterium]